MKNRRGNQREDNGGNGRRKFPPLEWSVVQAFNFGNVRALVSRAELDNGDMRYSFKIGKADRNDPERCKPFIDSRDIEDTDRALEAVEEYIAEARA